MDYQEHISKWKHLPADLETVSMRLDAVAELTDNEELFYSLQSVLGRFLDVDHLLSLCVLVPKQETVKTAESKITNIIHLKHSLELLDPLQQALRGSRNKLFSAYATVSSIAQHINRLNNYRIRPN